jgi:phage N-6-adenine-methyltransferase
MSNTPSTTRDNWGTPEDLYDEINNEFGPFTLDAAASHDNAKCSQYFTEHDDALTMEWFGSVWCNPPYRQLIKWVKKAFEEVVYGHCERVTMCLPAQTSTDWFHDYALPLGRLKWIKRKRRFGGAKWNAIMPTLVVVFDKQFEEFNR